MTAFQYINEYCVMDIYTLTGEQTLLSIVLSCEQGDYVYLENLTYDTTYGKYSPGSVLYGQFLGELIRKKKGRIS